jgi:hypothetical protein
MQSLEDVKAIVAKWYFEGMMINLNKKDVIHHQVGCESWETHATHFLQESEAKCQFPPTHDFFGCILIFEFLTFECLDIVFV